MVTPNQWPSATNLTQPQQKKYNRIQFIRHAYLPFLKTLLLECGSNNYFRHKALQMKALKQIHNTIKNCAQRDSAGCEITYAMKQTLQDSEFYFVLRQICNILHSHKNLFNLNQWNSVLIIDNFHKRNTGFAIVETKQLLIIMDKIKKYAMILHRKEFEHLNLGSSTGSNMKKYVNIWCATFVLQKVSFKNQDTVNMFFRICLQQLERFFTFSSESFFASMEMKTRKNRVGFWQTLYFSIWYQKMNITIVRLKTGTWQVHSDTQYTLHMQSADSLSVGWHPATSVVSSIRQITPLDPSEKLPTFVELLNRSEKMRRNSYFTRHNTAHCDLSTYQGRLWVCTCKKTAGSALVVRDSCDIHEAFARSKN